MAGLNLQAIHEALANQIQSYVGRQTNVAAFPDGSSNYPMITVFSDPSGYVDPYSTFSGNGYAEVMLRVKVEVDAVDDSSKCIKILDYLSVGTGNTSSVFDAIRSDHTLGGLIDDCKPGVFEWDSENDPGTAVIPVLLLVKKVGAQP
jgi:hypothetical protein